MSATRFVIESCSPRALTTAVPLGASTSPNTDSTFAPKDAPAQSPQQQSSQLWQASPPTCPAYMAGSIPPSNYTGPSSSLRCGLQVLSQDVRKRLARTYPLEPREACLLFPRHSFWTWSTPKTSSSPACQRVLDESNQLDDGKEAPLKAILKRCLSRPLLRHIAQPLAQPF